MTQYEFIQELEAALQGHVSPQVVEYNVNYYREYIREQLASGRTPEEVFELLGSPRMIAKTIISAEEAKGNAQEYKEAAPQTRGFHFSISEGKWYHKVLIAVVVLLVLSLIIRLAFAIVRILFWPVVIVAVGCVIWEYFKKK